MELVVIVLAAAAILYPIQRFVRSIFFARSVIFYGHRGELLGEISPEDVQQMKLDDLEQLHDRVQRDKHVRIRAVA